MKTYIKCFRKAYPQEILAQLEPLLTEKQFMWQDIISAFQVPLRKRGVEIYIVPCDAKDPYASSDWTRLCITDENPKSKVTNSESGSFYVGGTQYPWTQFEEVITAQLNDSTLPPPRNPSKFN